ncbi:J domain-containing protein [Pseudobutyrivibrio xylanivorans]|uniref:DnaJ domain-containing protein n=1 Tax=Pseudobutyrivibrio xylanivorans TaxID=185007 RepID=A0A5P6VPT1_PSEXY|nr:J domain-containing protein [Pseudobutyrivibrio xylanivorans]QFJ53689.1 DnaJ domain-containing protein [Pseudobutyrivibrio xylanivorans]
MTDPYKILGVTRDASDDEVKKAYRALSRKYHPDANINNPNKAQAEEVFKQVQAAYNQIMDERQNPGSFYGYSNNGYQGQNSSGYQRTYYNGYNQNAGNRQQQDFDFSDFSDWYVYRGRSYGYNRPYSGFGRWCASMIILNLLCNICCFI